MGIIAPMSVSVPLSIRIHGSGDRSVLLVHGWMMTSAVWDSVVPVLTEAGFRVLQPDLRGAGESHAADAYRLEDHANDLAALAESLKLSNLVVIGHSMGGQIAQMFAANHPELVSQLVLLNSVPASGMPLPAELMGLFSSSPGDRDKQGAILDMATTQLSSSGRERLLELAAAVQADAITGGLLAWTGGGFVDRLSDITAPTDIIATSDPFLPVAFLQSAIVDPIANATLHVLEGPGHYPQVEAPDKTAALLRDLISG